MTDDSKLVRGWVRGGVVVLEPGADLPDGSEVRVGLAADLAVGPLPPDMQAAFDQWQGLAQESWAMIDALEAEDRRNAAG